MSKIFCPHCRIYVTTIHNACSECGRALDDVIVLSKMSNEYYKKATQYIKQDDFILANNNITNALLLYPHNEDTLKLFIVINLELGNILEALNAVSLLKTVNVKLYNDYLNLIKHHDERLKYIANELF